MANLDLDLLRARFAAGLRKRIDAMIDCLREIAAAPGPRKTEELMRMFHSLAGIGGTYGFPRITDLARGGETTCLCALETCRPLHPSELDAVRRAVDGIAQVELSSPRPGGERVARSAG